MLAVNSVFNFWKAMSVSAIYVHRALHHSSNWKRSAAAISFFFSYAGFYYNYGLQSALRTFLFVCVSPLFSEINFHFPLIYCPKTNSAFLLIFAFLNFLLKQILRNSILIIIC
ncbi:hypothetical protein ASF92_01485 [Pedobacter sp. Leaf176]|nr:hypothetical protein ASF92_01485 [Pedobacter sp. Leaf176]